jgi:hypothetical protein
VVFVTDDYITRAWCCLEIAVATESGCKVTVVGSCKRILKKEFFESMVATESTDIPLIKNEIERLYGTGTKFNNIVARAMEVLYVEVHKRQVCKLFNTARSLRPDWSRNLSITKPPSLLRDRGRDFDVLSGAVDLSAVRSNNTSRSLRIYLLSTLTDLILEWSFFYRDVVPFLQDYARRCQLDLLFCDMRCGSREEEALPLDILMAEMERCKAESMGLCCFAILGDKYG